MRVFNVTFEQDLKQCGQLFITLMVGVCDKILVIFESLFIKGEEVPKKKITKWR